MCIDKVRDVGFVKAVSRFDLAEAEIDVFQLAVVDQTHDLISRGFEPGGGLF
jgi:hypothetical protein